MESFFAIIKVVVSLAFVLCLTYWCTRYLLPKLQGGASQGNMQIVERLPLGGRSSLCLVRAGARYILIGVTPTGIQYLTEIDDADLLFSEHSSLSVSDFASMFKTNKNRVRSFEEGQEGSHSDNELEM